VRARARARAQVYKMSHFNQPLQISLKQCILEKMF